MARARKEQRLELYARPAFQRLQHTLGENLRSLREDRGLTQEQAAELCGLPLISYVRVELGQTNTTLLTLTLIAEGYGVPAARLLLEVVQYALLLRPDAAFQGVADSAGETHRSTMDPQAGALKPRIKK